MKRAAGISVVTAILFSAAFSCGRVDADGNSGAELSASEKPDTVAEVETDMTVEALAWADSLIGQMTLEQRVGQLLLPAVYAADDPLSLRNISRYAADWHVGGVVLLKGSTGAVRNIASRLTEASIPPPFMAIDAEWGLGMRLSGTPVFPKNGQISPRAGQDLLYEYGREVARECRLSGINMVLGPVADVSASSGIMGRRSFGSNPERVAELTVAYARGLEDGNVISVAKHFPGHGSPGQDSHNGVAVVASDMERLDAVDLIPFKAYVNAGLSGVMAGHLAVPSVDSSLSPASFSRPILTGLLRDSLNFRGLVLTDALNMGGAYGYTAADALRAGADIVLAPADTGKEFQAIMSEIESGRLPVSLINDRCRRILFYKYLVKRNVPEMEPAPDELATPQSDSLMRSLSGS